VSAVYIPVALRLVGGRWEAGVPVVNVAGHEQSQLQYLRYKQNEADQSGLDGFNTAI